MRCSLPFWNSSLPSKKEKKKTSPSYKKRNETKNPWETSLAPHRTPNCDLFHGMERIFWYISYSPKLAIVNFSPTGQHPRISYLFFLFFFVGFFRGSWNVRTATSTLHLGETFQNIEKSTNPKCFLLIREAKVAVCCFFCLWCLTVV